MESGLHNKSLQLSAWLGPVTFDGVGNDLRVKVAFGAATELYVMANEEVDALT
jgi:hypothetical protein